MIIEWRRSNSVLKSAAATWLKFGFEYGCIFGLVLPVAILLAIGTPVLDLTTELRPRNAVLVALGVSLTLLEVFWCFVTLGWDAEEEPEE